MTIDMTADEWFSAQRRSGTTTPTGRCLRWDDEQGTVLEDVHITDREGLNVQFGLRRMGIAAMHAHRKGDGQWIAGDGYLSPPRAALLLADARTYGVRHGAERWHIDTVNRRWSGDNRLDAIDAAQKRVASRRAPTRHDLDTAIRDAPGQEGRAAPADATIDAVHAVHHPTIAGAAGRGDDDLIDKAQRASEPQRERPSGPQLGIGL